MFVKLKRYFILLYTTTAGTILLFTLFITYFIWNTQQKSHYNELFVNHLNQINYVLSFEPVITNTWLSKYEYENQLLIHIEDNGSPFFFPGSYITGKKRKELIAKAKAMAEREGIFTNTTPTSPEKSRSSVYTITTSDKTLYYCCVVLIPKEQNYKSLVLVQEFPNANKKSQLLIVILILLGFISVSILYMLSCFIIKKALKPAQDSIQKQKEFIAAASHELRAPLTIIQTSADSISQNINKRELFLCNITEECKRMNHLISDLLFLAASDAQTWKIKPEICDIDTFLIELYERYFHVCKELKHNFILKLPETPMKKLSIDKHRLSQVLGILIDNALSYSPVNTTITVSACEKKNFLQIRVIDEGSGIPKEMEKKIFDRFYRADKSRSDKHHFGLGLCIAKELIKLHHGTICLENSQEVGAVFLISLPLEQ